MPEIKVQAKAEASLPTYQSDKEMIAYIELLVFYKIEWNI